MSIKNWNSMKTSSLDDWSLLKDTQTTEKTAGTPSIDAVLNELQKSFNAQYKSLSSIELNIHRIPSDQAHSKKNFVKNEAKLLKAVKKLEKVYSDPGSWNSFNAKDAFNALWAMCFEANTSYNITRAYDEYRRH